jgi:vesicle coat complex subunit
MADAIDQCEAIQFKIGDVTSLIILLSSPDPLICAASLDGLTKYADQGPKQKQYLYSTGIIKTLIELSKDKKVRKSSVCLLSSLTELSHPDMQRKDLLQQLIAILNKEDQPEIIDEAAYCIANISQDFGLKAEIRKSGGIQILVKLLDNPDPDVKKNCALALLSCIEDFTNRAEMRHAKGLRPLLDLLLSEHQEVQELALKCLLKCSEDHSNVVELRKQSAIRKLLDFVTIEANEPQFQQALQCLLFQIEDAESVHTFVECNGLAPLMKLTSHDDVPIRKQASFCLAKALLFEKNQVAARDFGLIPTIVQQVNAIDVNACAAACTVIGALAKNGIDC